MPGHRTPRSIGLLIKAVWHSCRINKQVTVNQPPWTSFAGQSRTFPAYCVTPDRVRQIGIHVANRKYSSKSFQKGTQSMRRVAPLLLGAILLLAAAALGMPSSSAKASEPNPANHSKTWGHHHRHHKHHRHRSQNHMKRVPNAASLRKTSW